LYGQVATALGGLGGEQLKRHERGVGRDEAALRVESVAKFLGGEGPGEQVETGTTLAGAEQATRLGLKGASGGFGRVGVGGDAGVE
jgi:hypothetical protein